MIGRKNIVFGFLYLVLTAALGPYMVLEVIPGMGEAGAAKQQSMSELQLMASSGFEKDLEPMDADAIARSNTQALLDLNRMLQSEAQLDEIKGGPHTHGNLESVLNILAGLTLLFLTVPAWWKQAISWASSQWSFKVILTGSVGLSTSRARRASQGMAIVLAKRRNAAMDVDRPTLRAPLWCPAAALRCLTRE